MATSHSQSLVLQAIAALQAFDRRRAVALLRQELDEGPQSGERWRSVNRLAVNISQFDVAMEAARRVAATPPPRLEPQLFYWGELASYGRSREALALAERLSANDRRHPGVLHLLGALAGQHGDFETAEAYYREALAVSPLLPQTWFALSAIKTFAAGDKDLAAMELLQPEMARAEPQVHARFLYGLAKAYHDCGEYDRAFTLYSEGAALRRRAEPFDAAALERFADGLIRGFTREGMQRLTPSGAGPTRALFVNGLARSGTTLVEQILASHSRVSDGAEANLLKAALIPTGDFSIGGALAYQSRFGGADPWGAIAADYEQLLETRFGSSGLVVDKTLSQSHFMGLLLHSLPDAKVVWLRRNPEDAAISCFRTFFTEAIPWSWSLADIGTYFRIEDRLHAHWTKLFPERILTVPYEQLVSDPEQWIRRILAHVCLDEEPGVFAPHRTKRSVMTASVQQVRAPISTRRVGAAAAYDRNMGEFRNTYRG